MFKQKGVEKKSICQNAYQGVTLTGSGREIEKEWAVHHCKKQNAENVLNQPIKSRQM